MTAAIAPVLKYPGSKWKLANWIIKHMPKHESYLEPFFGSGAVFFRKPPLENETIGDIDGDIVNLFKMIRDRSDELAKLVEMTPWSRFEFESIEAETSAESSFIHSGDSLEDARRFLIRCWMAYGAKTDGKVGWACNIRPTTYGAITKRWNQVPTNILAISTRLKNAQIECQPSVKLIQRYRYPGVLIYADPPYVRSTLTQRHYKHMMTNSQHIELLEALNEHPGPVLLSGYQSKLYSDYLSHWKTKAINAYAQGTKLRQEILWINPVAAKDIEQTLDFDFENIS